MQAENVAALEIDVRELPALSTSYQITDFHFQTHLAGSIPSDTVVQPARSWMAIQLKAHQDKRRCVEIAQKKELSRVPTVGAGGLLLPEEPTPRHLIPHLNYAVRAIAYRTNSKLVLTDMRKGLLATRARKDVELLRKDMAWSRDNLNMVDFANIMQPIIDELDHGVPLDAKVFKHGSDGLHHATVSFSHDTRSFTSFSQLPKELRDKIWLYAARDSELDCRIALRFDLGFVSRSVAKVCNESIVPLTSLPPLMTTCMESFEAVLRSNIYRSSFDTKVYPARCMFNHRNDRLVLHADSTLEYSHVSHIFCREGFLANSCV